MRGLRLGIVGSEAAKFTPATERAARAAICGLFHKYKPVEVVSGACPLGGIDLWAIEEAKGFVNVCAGAVIPVATTEYAPQVHEWQPHVGIGYKERNLQIVKRSDVVVCITVKELPKEYLLDGGMRFDSCYHCGTTDHVKSGGCWTMKEAKRAGKGTELVVIG